MRHGFVRPLVVAAVVAAAALPMAAASAASPTWTRITTPSGASYTANKFTFSVAGAASSDVTSVDIDCVGQTADSGTQSVNTLATNVSVTNGRFSTEVHATTVFGVCRLHAVPSQATTNGFFASYSGPVLYLKLVAAQSGSGSAGSGTGFVAIDERPGAVAAFGDVGSCGNAALSTVDGASLSTLHDQTCAFAVLPSNGASPSTANASGVTVDGQNAYLPSGVSALGLSPSPVPAPLSVKVIKPANGDLVVTESALLQKCSGSNVYPPTATSCPTLVSTGVRFTRTIGIVRGSHQLRLRDTFTSTSGAHKVRVRYVNGLIGAADTGSSTDSTGYVIPPSRKGFVAPPAGKVVTRLGTRAASVLVRSDRFAAADDPQADTQAFTWSAAPSDLAFGPEDSYTFGMDYALSVPARGAADLGFALSEGLTTTSATELATAAVGEMASAPSITSPRNGATVEGRTVTVAGSVGAGANGLPKSVSVNGHAARLTRDSAVKATWKVRVTSSYGTHTLTATATDTAGNQAKRSIRVRFVKK